MDSTGKSVLIAPACSRLWSMARQGGTTQLAGGSKREKDQMNNLLIFYESQSIEGNKGFTRSWSGWFLVFGTPLTTSFGLRPSNDYKLADDLKEEFKVEITLQYRLLRVSLLGGDFKTSGPYNWTGWRNTGYWGCPHVRKTQTLIIQTSLLAK